MIQEFKTFIARGNVIDLAVGIIIGAAFTGIVNSLVVDLINPILGLMTGGIDFTDKYVVLSGNVADGASLAAARDSGAAIFAYGAFAMAVLNFLIVAWAVFLLVKGVNRLQRAAMRKEEAKETPPAGPTQEELLAQIRDLLADRASPA
ncbi:MULTISPECIES: large conductance mechanosensitive channel protein MscL [Paracoccus]|jgi:large conductance mechanosensitive channel|uniref:Large-conductance mechanosensitive channel n=3 Tax=Pseudomonadota TaxID=1224 RepID=A0A5C4R9K0_9RHOB|nr:MULTISPECIES: large conductance mechanosensitive channel protein MscL [Paracoccus]TYP67609.1 large conductance mechanosensitive channel [Stutzerimonas stutzeri]AZY92875.1 large conductance mechanosensitive channel protein MscL [Paracoccus sp. Arc7-R13]KIX17723.1 mechanosensitive ion channel protein MscL [Paracoccus sp. 228]KJZ32795.1 mechanosensitive ion channel protein MscL [Paracoccus sp. S4493]MBF5079375.1 large conductance mechanosensitive channel protein MscL [Paracoccus sp. NBH48]